MCAVSTKMRWMRRCAPRNSPGRCWLRLYLPLDATATQSADAATPALVQPAATTPAAHAAQAPEVTTLRRVLVVDDEAGLCELACTLLQSLGYEATSVLSPDAALAQLAGQHFDVLFTDVVMPRPMDGIDLARAASARQPGLRVLLTSGYARNLNDKGPLPGPLLNKPYRKNDLARGLA